MTVNETDKGYKAYKGSPYYHKYMQTLDTIPEEAVDQVLDESRPVLKKNKKMNVASFFVVLFGLLYLAVCGCGYFLKADAPAWLVSCLSIYNNTNGVAAILGFIQNIPAFTAENALVYTQMILFALSIVMVLVGFFGGLISIVQRGTGKVMKIGCSVVLAFTIVYQAIGYFVNHVYTYGTFITLGCALLIFLATVCNGRKLSREEIEAIAIAKANGTYKKKQVNPVSFFVALFGLLYLVLSVIGYFVQSNVDWVQSILTVSRTLDGVHAVFKFIEECPAVFAVENILAIVQIFCYMISLVFAVIAFFSGLIVIVREETGKVMKVGCGLFALFAAASTVIGCVMENNYFIGAILIAEFALCALICALLGKKKKVVKAEPVLEKAEGIEEAPEQEPVEEEPDENYLDFVPDHYQLEDYLAGPSVMPAESAEQEEEEPESDVFIPEEDADLKIYDDEIVPVTAEPAQKKGKKMNVASFFIFFFSLLFIACSVVGKFYQSEIGWVASLLGVYNGTNTVDTVMSFVQSIPAVFTVENVIPLCSLFLFFLTTIFAVFAFVGGLIAVCKKYTGKLMKTGCTMFFIFSVLYGLVNYYLTQTYTYGLFAVIGLAFLCFLTAICAKGKPCAVEGRKPNVAHGFVSAFGLIFLLWSVLGIVFRTDIAWLNSLFAVQGANNGITAIVEFVKTIPAVFVKENALAIAEIGCYMIAVVLALLAFFGGLIARKKELTGIPMKVGCALFFVFMLASFVLEYVATKALPSYGMIAVTAIAFLTFLTALCAKKKEKEPEITVDDEIITLVDSSADRTQETEVYGSFEEDDVPEHDESDSVIAPMLEEINSDLNVQEEVDGDAEENEYPDEEGEPVAKPEKKKKMNVASFFVSIFALLYLAVNAVGYFLKDVAIDWVQSILSVYNGTDGVNAIMTFVKGIPENVLNGELLATIQMGCYALSIVLALAALIGGFVAITKQHVGKLMKVGCAFFLVFAIATEALSYITTKTFAYGMVAVAGLALILSLIAFLSGAKKEEKKRKMNAVSFFVALFGLLTIVLCGIGYLIPTENEIVKDVFAVYNGQNGVAAVLAFIPQVPAILTVDNIIPLVEAAAFALMIVFALFAFVGGLIAIVQKGTGKLMKVGCGLFFVFAVVFLAMTLVQQLSYTIGLIAVCVLACAALVAALCGKMKEKKACQE